MSAAAINLYKEAIIEIYDLRDKLPTEPKKQLSNLIDSAFVKIKEGEDRRDIIIQLIEDAIDIADIENNRGK